jgi:predicted helicase
MTKIYHAHLYGKRDSKYDWLQGHDVLSTDWQEIKPQAPFYLLIPQNTDLLIEYEQGWKITDIMPVNSTGVKTHRDHFAIDFDAEKLKNRIAEFRNLEIPEDVIATKYSLSNTIDWKINARRRSLAFNENWEKYLTKCLYRPFDIRAYCHHQDVVERPRNEVMQHFLNRQNMALICKRQSLEPEIRNYFSCSDEIVADGYFAADNKGRDNTFPLYLYPERNGLTQELHPNLSTKFLKELTAQLSYTPTPEAIFYYIYAVFHSPTYRSRYAEFLKIDFPRVPLTSNDELFRQLSSYGEELVALHLMKSSKLDNLITKFVENSGNCIVDPGHPKYDENSNSVLINKKGDKFTEVPKAVWEFYVGGYQVCQKWLKDRKGRTLSEEDITHYQRIVVALQETIHLMQKIDEAIPGFPLE